MYKRVLPTVDRLAEEGVCVDQEFDADFNGSERYHYRGRRFIVFYEEAEPTFVALIAEGNQ